MSGLPTRCERCGVKLLPHRLIPKCQECKHIERGERLAANVQARAEVERQREARRAAIAARHKDLDAEGNTP